MRKVIKRPDGTEEVVEGTAEEIAEYERQIKEGGKPQTSKKKPVLHGAEVDGKPLTDEEIIVIRLSRAGVLPKEKEIVREPVYIPQWVPYRLEPAEPTCWVCGQRNCRQMHIWCGTQTFTSDSTSPEKVSLLIQEDGTSKPSHSLSDILMGRDVVEVKTNETPPGFGPYEMYPKH